MSLGKTILRNTVWSGVDTLVEMVVPQLISILVARKLGPAKLGPFAYVMWVSSLTLVIGQFGISTAVRKYLGDALGKDHWHLARQIVRRAIVMQLFLATAAVVLGLTWVLVILPKSERIYASLAVVSVLPTLSMAIATAVNSTLETLFANVVSSLCATATHAIGTLLALFLDWGLEGLAAALLVARVVDCIVRSQLATNRFQARLHQRPEQRSEHNDAQLPPTLRREMLAFCLQAAILALLNVVVWSRSEMFFIKHFCDSRQLAFYSVAFTFAIFPKSLATPFTNAAVASLYAERGRNASRGQRVAELCVRYQALIVLPVAGGLAALSGPLVRILYGAKYAEAAPVMAWAMALGAIAPFSDPAIDLLRAAAKQRLLIAWTAVAGLGVLALDWFLVRAFCAVGGAVANGLGQSVFTLGVFVLARRQHAFKVQGLYLVRVALICSVMALGVAHLQSLLPDLAVLFVGPPAGFALFLLGLRYGRVFDEEDGHHLGTLQTVVPRRIRPGFERLLAWLQPGQNLATPP